MKRFLVFVVSLFLLVLIIILYNTITYESKQVSIKSQKFHEISKDVVYNLSKAIRFKTVSYEDNINRDSAEFLKFHSLLKIAYPYIDSLLEKTVISEYSLLYKWAGSNPDLNPIVLMAHQDVVPVDESSIDKWPYDPFGGKIANDTIYGRGSLDDKGSLMAIMESVEWLLKKQFKPNRTIYLAFGHDEEIGGINGAKRIAAHLLSQGIKAETILDEGMVIARGLVPGVHKDVAMIGIAEKGFVTIELFIEQEPGHSSTPEKESAIDILANALTKLHKNQRPAFISKPLQQFLDYVGPEMPFIEKMIFANTWLFKSLLISIYEGSAAGNASVRTTMAPTIFQGGIKENVMPSSARAVINFRIIPGETIEMIKDHVINVIDDKRIQVRIMKGFENDPSPVSPTTSYGFETINKTFHEVFPSIISAPSLMVGGSDTKHYHDLSKNIYRIIPIPVSNLILSSIHGINERIAIEDYENAIQYYIRLIENFNQ
jgi:carboxypeptidase PM20D1